MKCLGYKMFVCVHGPPLIAVTETSRLHSIIERSIKIELLISDPPSDLQHEGQ